MQFAKNEYFEVVGGDTGRRYRIYPGTMSNVCEIDETGHPRLGLCFRTTGELPIGDGMLAQEIGLENCESSVLAVAKSFVPGILCSGEAGFSVESSLIELSYLRRERSRPPGAPKSKETPQ